MRVFESASEPFDGILLDSHLGDGLGADFLKRATEHAAAGNKPFPSVISMSGSPLSEQHALYSDYKILAFLVKPISKQELMSLVRII